VSSLPFEIQDLSSQETLSYCRPQRYEHWWDACAASGGKSLLLFSEEPHIKLVVSDIRESVLNNLDERFIGAGLRTYQKKLIDLTKNPDPVLHSYQFDGIILDAPCTGSGTWGRTPEMISQFEEFKIQGFQSLQRSIAANVIKYLKPGKPLIYITCSVFREENEQVVAHLQSDHGLKLESSEVLKGYEHKADTMFVARLLK
jgi:16S rRNA (cytosine967-C5)-methyltransferase